MTEAGMQEVAARSKPVMQIAEKNELRKHCVMKKYWIVVFTKYIPRVCEAALLQTNVTNIFQLHQQKLDCRFHCVSGLGQLLLIPGINPE